MENLAGALGRGRFERFRDLGGVFHHVADLAGVHLGDLLFSHAEADETLALLQLAATLGTGGFAGAGLVGFVIFAVLGQESGWLD